MDTVQPAIPNTSNTSSSSQLSPAPSTFQASSPTGQSSSANKWLIIIGISLFLILIIVIFVSVSFYLSNKRNSQYVTTNTQITNPTQPVVSNKTPYGELSLALDKTIAVKTLYMDYKTQVESRLAFAKTGLTQTLHNNVDGYITGSTDGKTGKWTSEYIVTKTLINQ
jgi:hypothetical protein